MRKNKMMRAASGLLVATLLTTSVISGTFAKYTSTASGNDTATVAKWSFEAMGEEIAVTGDKTNLKFNLFDTINDTGNAAPEEDVADNKIAPGTAGSFEIKVKNTSEVTAEYTIALSETNNSNIPLQYSLDGTNWVDSIGELTMTGLTKKQLDIGAAEATHTVYWRWMFEGTTSGAHDGQTDATDTALGITAQKTDKVPTVTIKATITATQVD